MAISESVKESWCINDKVNKVLLEHLTAEMVEAQTPGEGYSVAQHLAHMAEARKFWSAMLDEEGTKQLPDLFKNERLAETNLAQIKDVFRQTSSVTLGLAETATDTKHFPYTSLDVYLIHLIAHDAHHRGQILLALKTSGHALPSEGALWGSWRPE
ncbi:MAG: DinB family protein [Trueperaceae bacterium]